MPADIRQYFESNDQVSADEEGMSNKCKKKKKNESEKECFKNDEYCLCEYSRGTWKNNQLTICNVEL